MFKYILIQLIYISFLFTFDIDEWIYLKKVGSIHSIIEDEELVHFITSNGIYSYDDINILYHLGFCYLKINDYTNAAKYFKSIIRINPDHPETHNNLISIYAKLNKLKEARKECDILFMLDRELYYLNSFCIN